MPPVTLMVHQLESTRRTRSSRLMPVTRGSSPTWGDPVVSRSGRGGSMPAQDRGLGRVEMARRRQARLASMPDQRQVEQVRVEERGRGGPPAPHNSLDISVINLNDTVAIDEDPEVFINQHEVPTPEEGDSSDDSSDDIVGVPPLDPNTRAWLDAAIAQREMNDIAIAQREMRNAIAQRTREMIDIAIAQTSSTDTTIDLTDSPVRSTLPSPASSTSPPSSPGSESPPSSPLASSPSSASLDSSNSSASLKCPVCLETFYAIRKRGSRLVSTTCGHVFCGRCLPACVRTSGQCPTCRRRIGYKDFHPLYLY
eukprot:GFUD01038304.1.p1 GENE.GFUD01038304.1~~GFUD01038304.1.p1  ORF type:complete len:311 (-),score=59.50 GFUD01038304.1:131-1063(-)